MPGRSGVFVAGVHVVDLTGGISVWCRWRSRQIPSGSEALEAVVQTPQAAIDEHLVCELFRAEQA